jgi:DNA gyrase subunit A
MFTVSPNDESKYLVFATKQGLIKRCDIREFDSIRSNGKLAISLKENDELISVKKTDGTKFIVLASSNGRLVRFNEEEIRIMGRTASGVRGINLGDGYCIDANIAEPGKEVLVVTENGYGKRTTIDDYRITHRGSKGVKTLNSTEKTGAIVAFKVVSNDEDLMIITNSGIVIRIPMLQISIMSRVTQGVRLISLKDGQKVTSVFNIIKDDEEEAQISE